MSETTDEDLWKLGKRYNILLNNICFKDLLNESAPRHGAYIINLADSTDHGTHWTALFLESPSQCAYFDSFGIACPLAVEEFARRWGCRKIIMSNVQIQSLNSGWCGEYSIDFLAFMSRHPKMELEKRYRLFLNQFHKDK